MDRLKLKFGCMVFLFCFMRAANSFSQDVDDLEFIRDPFVPLVDNQGEMRKYFHKPQMENLGIKVTLTGISQVGEDYYALIDGELVKAGDTFKEFTVAKVDADKVILSLGDKFFELKWESKEK